MTIATVGGDRLSEFAPEEDSTIVKILTFDDKTGNPDLDSQLDETATVELFERASKPVKSADELSKILQEGIYS